MLKRNYPDAIGGGVLVLIGLISLAYSLLWLPLGTMSRMETGMFPAIISFILTMLGGAIVLTSFRRRDAGLSTDPRSFAAILASISVFALLLRPFGLIAAVIGLTLVATRADNKLSLSGLVLLAACLSLLATAIFKIGLGLPVPIISWPW